MGVELTTLMMTCADCFDKCKTNCHTFAATTAPKTTDFIFQFSKEKH
jgi:hypothetical protein